jgi:protocatechuate 3,4-dioxygenase beta subunit
VVLGAAVKVDASHLRRAAMNRALPRPLPRPDKDIDDQGLGFDLATVMSRRRLLAVFGLGAAGVGLAACDSSASTSTAALSEIPDETAGPYPGDGSNGSNVLTGSGVVRTDIRSSFGTSTTTAPGIPMTLTLDIRDMAKDNAAFEGAAVYVWHCDRDGNYSLYSTGVEDENYLRGVQIVNTAGTVTFTSIFPACYSGRWPHIHFEVYSSVAKAVANGPIVKTSQIAMPKSICKKVYATSGYSASVRNLAQTSLSSDNVFSDDKAIHQLATVTGSVSKGFVANLTVGV